MRLSGEDRQHIKRCAAEAFGADVRVYLFGSRADDSRAGGDIDLYVVPGDRDGLFHKRLDFLARLLASMEEQRIDVVVARDEARLIEREAMRTGVLL